MRQPITIVHYLDVLSSWSLISQGALDAVTAEFGDAVSVDWRIALFNDGAPVGEDSRKWAWYYDRIEAMTGVKLNPSWRESLEDSTLVPNSVAVAARRLGATGDAVRLALARAAMVDGRKVQHRQIALDVAVEASGMAREALAAALDDPLTRAELDRTTKEYRTLPVSVVPVFLVSNPLNDVALLSGYFQAHTLRAVVAEAVETMRRYDAFMAR
ncbi:MAG: DsbA family protein [Candidatus Eremiobacteraeota bacterium]|nr:DsbA family protein [Candidatus Eremiobacteraeota bacterium]